VNHDMTKTRLDKTGLPLAVPAGKGSSHSGEFERSLMPILGINRT